MRCAGLTFAAILLFHLLTMASDAPEVEDVFRLAGTSVEGRFGVERAIAEGGFGVVYRARQEALDRPVAIKVLKTPEGLGVAAQDHFLGAFAAEARTIARITHPNIVQVYDFGVSVMPSGERAAWMALEWLTGLTLEDELYARRGKGGRNPADCLRLLRPVLGALATVHAAGVAHRDLKPANIMLVPMSGGTVPKLLDFGIAKIMRADEDAPVSHRATRSQHIAFSPAYASPEQVSHGRSGPWTDVHALSLIMTELLTDQPPLEGTTSTHLFQQILDRARPTPARFGVDVGAWEAVLGRAAAVTPAERYADASELLEALEATLGDASHISSAAPVENVTPSDTPVVTPVDARSPSVVAAQRTPPGVTVQLEPALRRSARARARWIVALAGVSLAAIGVAIVASAGRHPLAPSTLGSVAVGTSTRSTSVEVVAKPPPTGAPEPAPSVASAPPVAPTIPAAHASGVPKDRPRPVSAMTASPPPLPPAPAATKPTVNCNPPFTIDPTGQRHYKPECDN